MGEARVGEAGAGEAVAGEALQHCGDAELAAALLAIDPLGLKGAVVRARHGPARDLWRTLLGEFWQNGPYRMVLPRNASLERLLGGIDVSATLARGALVAQPGLLQELSLSGAIVSIGGGGELEAPIASTIAAAIDAPNASGRDEVPGFLVFDESADDEPVAAAQALVDRLAFFVDLSAMSHRAFVLADYSAEDVCAARRLLARVVMADQSLAALCQASMRLGIHSLRADDLAARCARAAAALAGRLVVEEDDLLVAVRLVLLPRASAGPSAAQEEATTPDDPLPDREEHDQFEAADTTGPDSATSPPSDGLDDIGVDVVGADLLAKELLDQLVGADVRDGSMRATGRRTSKRAGIGRGKPMGVRAASSARGQRLNLVATLQAAAPWQRIRRQDARRHAHVGRSSDACTQGVDDGRVIVRRQDFRVTRYRQSEGQTIIFAVDASGSTALGRLGEAKGAVELLLGQSYCRRDEVALISFRDQGAQIILAPTRSLVRAKRVLASLPGGGATPLATGLNEAAMLAETVARGGRSPIVVLISDGRGNIALDGRADRGCAAEDAVRVAGRLRRAGYSSLMFDVSPRRQPFGRQLADAMGGGYHHLPVLRSDAVADTVRAALNETMQAS